MRRKNFYIAAGVFLAVLGSVIIFKILFPGIFDGLSFLKIIFEWWPALLLLVTIWGFFKNDFGVPNICLFFVSLYLTLMKVDMIAASYEKYILPACIIITGVVFLLGSGRRKR